MRVRETGDWSRTTSAGAIEMTAPAMSRFLCLLPFLSTLLWLAAAAAAAAAGSGAAQTRVIRLSADYMLRHTVCTMDPMSVGYYYYTSLSKQLGLQETIFAVSSHRYISEMFGPAPFLMPAMGLELVVDRNVSSDSLRLLVHSLGAATGMDWPMLDEQYAPPYAAGTFYLEGSKRIGVVGRSGNSGFSGLLCSHSLRMALFGTESVGYDAIFRNKDVRYAGLKMAFSPQAVSFEVFVVVSSRGNKQRPAAEEAVPAPPHMPLVHLETAVSGSGRPFGDILVRGTVVALHALQVPGNPKRCPYGGFALTVPLPPADMLCVDLEAATVSFSFSGKSAAVNSHEEKASSSSYYEIVDGYRIHFSPAERDGGCSSICTCSNFTFALRIPARKPFLPPDMLGPLQHQGYVVPPLVLSVYKQDERHAESVTYDRLQCSSPIVIMGPRPDPSFIYNSGVMWLACTILLLGSSWNVLSERHLKPVPAKRPPSAPSSFPPSAGVAGATASASAAVASS